MLKEPHNNTGRTRKNRKRKTKADFDLWRGLIVKVVWLDPLSCDEINESEIDKEPDIIFTTYGEVVGKNSKNLSIASTTANEPRDRLLREVLRIPLPLIKSIVLLIPNEQEVLNV